MIVDGYSYCGILKYQPVELVLDTTSHMRSVILVVFGPAVNQSRFIAHIHRGGISWAFTVSSARSTQ